MNASTRTAAAPCQNQDLTNVQMLGIAPAIRVRNACQRDGGFWSGKRASSLKQRTWLRLLSQKGRYDCPLTLELVKRSGCPRHGYEQYQNSHLLHVWCPCCHFAVMAES